MNAHQGAEGEDSSPVKTKQEPVGAAEGGPPLSPVHWRAGGSGDASNGSSLSPSALHIAAADKKSSRWPGAPRHLRRTVLNGQHLLLGFRHLGKSV